LARAEVGPSRVLAETMATTVNSAMTSPRLRQDR